MLGSWPAERPRRVAVLVGRVDAGAALDQAFGRLQGPVARGFVQRRAPRLLGVDVGARVEQEVHRRYVVELGRRVQTGLERAGSVRQSYDLLHPVAGDRRVDRPWHAVFHQHVHGGQPRLPVYLALVVARRMVEEFIANEVPVDQLRVLPDQRIEPLAVVAAQQVQELRARPEDVVPPPLGQLLDLVQLDEELEAFVVLVRPRPLHRVAAGVWMA